MEIYQPTVNFARDKAVVAFIKDRLLHGEPCAVVGMHGNGIEYPFAVLTREVPAMSLPYQIKILDTVVEDELHDFIAELQQDENPTICLIKLRIGKDVSWFITALESIRVKRGFSFVPCVFSYVGDVYRALVEMKKILTTSLFILQPISYKEADDMLVELSERFAFYPTENQKKEIYQWSYGHVALIKSLYLLKKEHPEKTFTEEFLLSEPSILHRLTGIVQDMPKEIVDTLEKRDNNPLLFIFSEKFGYIKSGKLFHPLLEKLLPQRVEPINTVFSTTELKVFQYLKHHMGKLVSREDIARIIWGVEDWEDKYSEWAIGQLIYRIRKKLQKTQEHLDIQTKKGEGFILLQK